MRENTENEIAPEENVDEKALGYLDEQLQDRYDLCSWDARALEACLLFASRLAGAIQAFLIRRRGRVSIRRELADHLADAYAGQLDLGLAPEEVWRATLYPEAPSVFSLIPRSAVFTRMLSVVYRPRPRLDLGRLSQ